LCVRAGGSLSGEHGIGIEKMKAIGYMFTETDQQWMRGLRSVFNPDGLCNPGKIFPTGKTCVEVDVRHRKAAL
jgi:glycolate oxidase